MTDPPSKSGLTPLMPPILTDELREAAPLKACFRHTISAVRTDEGRNGLQAARFLTP